MKKLLALALITFIGTAFVSPQHTSAIDEANIKGMWWNAEKTAKIRIFRATNKKYYGEIKWLKEPNDENGNPKTDPENPKKELQSRARLGMRIMNGFEWNSSENKWENGTIYDPSNGKTYDGYATMNVGDNDKLYLRGYVMGMTWLGRTSEWQRVK